MRSLACKSPGELISARTICAPLEWRVRAVASPIPLAAPVITAPTPVKFVKATCGVTPLSALKLNLILMYNVIFMISPDLEKIEQIIAAEVVAPAVEQNRLLASHTVV